MNKVLIVITRQGDPDEIGPNRLYPQAKEYAHAARRIIVVQGKGLVPQDPNTGAPSLKNFNAKIDSLKLNSDEVGVTVHCSATDIAQWKERFGEIVKMSFKIGRYSSDGMEELYTAHKAMAKAFQVGNDEAKAKTFDTFWSLCFSDPILEDLILLLKTHALKKADGTVVTDLEALKNAIYRPSGGQSAGNEQAISSEAARLVSEQLNGGSGYEALRTALVKAIVARNGHPNS